jgi:hypothetical protein
MRYICYIYCIMSMSIKVSDNNVYMIHIHLYRSGPIWLDILCTQIAGDNLVCKILTPNITYKFNYLTCHVIQTKYKEYPTKLDCFSIHVEIKYDNIQVRISYCFTLKHIHFR